MLAAESFLERNSTAFQLVATAIGLVLTGLGGWWVRNRQKKSKTFGFRTLSDLAILSHRPDDDLLKVMYGDEEIDHPRILRVRLANTGTEVIRHSEVLEPIVLTVSARIVSMMVDRQSGQIVSTFNLTAPNYPACEIELPIATMNPDDSFTLRMIVDSEEPPEMKLSGRIEGQTSPPAMYLTYAEQMAPRWLFSSGAIVSGFFAVVGIAGLLYIHSSHPQGDQVIYAYGFASTPLLIALFIFVFASVIGWRGHRDRNPTTSDEDQAL